MHMLVVWNLLGGVISASRVGGSDSPNSKRHAVLALGKEGTEQTDLKFVKRFTGPKISG